jgi:mono/diheme cytochrome c family protein
MDSEVQRWDKAQRSVVTPVSAEPAYDLASVETGRRLFIKSSCYNCHGADAKGQTEWLSPEFLAAQEDPDATDKVEINYDAWGDPAPAANITARMLHGGRRPLDIYRRIFTGINGTPMPQFDQQFKDDPDAIWHMVHYVMHIVDGGDPTVGISVADVQAAIEAANKAQEAETSGSDEVDSEQAEQKKAA